MRLPVSRKLSILIRISSVFFLCWQPPALPCRLQHSTIGRLRLNLRVRDVNGCFPKAHRHQQLFSYLVFSHCLLFSFHSLESASLLLGRVSRPIRLRLPGQTSLSCRLLLFRQCSLITQQQNNTLLDFLRKEVIQPHLPIRLPCYDFTPVIEPAFGSSLLTVGSLTSGIPNSHGVTGGVYKTRERIHRDILIRDY